MSSSYLNKEHNWSTGCRVIVFLDRTEMCLTGSLRYGALPSTFFEDKSKRRESYVGKSHQTGRPNNTF